MAHRKSASFKRFVGLVIRVYTCGKKNPRSNAFTYASKDFELHPCGLGTCGFCNEVDSMGKNGTKVSNNLAFIQAIPRDNPLLMLCVCSCYVVHEITLGASDFLHFWLGLVDAC